MARAKKTTIHDVAKAANVSITAVSFALNGKGTLSDQTREHIIGTAERIGYQADALARGLTRSTGPSARSARWHCSAGWPRWCCRI
ncbi:LacI family DNA-binding transcriptional regulator [Glutamicibacter sp.]|uniref:LacI family DNA-binding transcriptional regulator n=1 Tax=Glutamicibacter sp. TaxID=1931995 RepID=UPI0037C16E0A